MAAKKRNKKKNKNRVWARWIGLRRGVQITVFLLFLLTVIQAKYPFVPWIPPEFFLQLDPLAAFTTLIANRFWIPALAISFIVLLSPLVVGRAFCGWICPLGTVIDTTDKVIAPKKETFGRKLRYLKTAFLFVFLIAVIGGLQYTWLFDPLPLLWRTFGAVIMPGVTFLLNGFFGLLFAAGADWDWMYTAQDWLAMNGVPLKATWVDGWWLVLSMFVILIGLSRLSKRFWCRNLCPLGALLGVISKISPFQRVVDSTSCTNCKLCQRGCKMDAIEDDYVTTEKQECIFCLNCADVCLSDGTKFTYRSPVNQVTPVDLDRRKAITTAATGIVATGAIQLTHNEDNRDLYAIRPPGAVEESLFIDRCIRCNECVRVCSTTGNCLQPGHFETGLAGFWTPIADFKAGYCEFTCNLCGEVCPTEAIRLMPVDFKQRRRMGLAVFNEDLCIPYVDKKDCLVCEEHCPTYRKAIFFKFEEQVDEDGNTYTLKLPLVSSGDCIGCGICENVCPVEKAPAIRVTREQEVRLSPTWQYQVIDSQDS